MAGQTATQNPAQTRRGRKPTCKHPLPGDKKCGLAQGHQGEHKPRQTVKRDLSVLGDADLTMREPTAAMDAATAPARTRSDKQQAVDKLVRQRHELWAALPGKPTVWGKIPRNVKGEFVLDPPKAELMRFMLRSAGDFLNIRVKFGTPARMSATLANGQPNPDAGKEVVVFVAMDKSKTGTASN